MSSVFLLLLLGVLVVNGTLTSSFGYSNYNEDSVEPLAGPYGLKHHESDSKTAAIDENYKLMIEYLHNQLEEKEEQNRLRRSKLPPRFHNFV